jgi:hypothetical protein
MKRKNNKSDAYDMTTARQSKIRKIEGKKLIVVLEDCSLESDKVCFHICLKFCFLGWKQLCYSIE